MESTTLEISGKSNSEWFTSEEYIFQNTGVFNAKLISFPAISNLPKTTFIDSYQGLIVLNEENIGGINSTVTFGSDEKIAIQKTPGFNFNVKKGDTLKIKFKSSGNFCPDGDIKLVCDVLQRS